MDNPHLTDDFHRVLVQYLKEGFPVKGNTKTPIFKSLKMTLYEISLPELDKENRQKNLT